MNSTLHDSFALFQYLPIMLLLAQHREQIIKIDQNPIKIQNLHYLQNWNW